jgi:hypothetical protein
MTIKALTGLVPEWYTPTSEEDADNPASFEIMALTSPQIAKLQGEFDRETGEISGVGLYESAVLGIKNWRNVTNHEGEVLAFSRRNIDLLPYTTIIEVGGKVLANSFVTEDDQKN